LRHPGVRWLNDIGYTYLGLKNRARIEVKIINDYRIGETYSEMKEI
jgi:hypothetical protein